MNILKQINRHYLVVSFFVMLIMCSSTSLFASESEYYIYGKCETVEGEILEGFISFNGDILWLSNFKSEKLKNPYSHLFRNNKGVRFSGGTTSTPSNHSFICRYNNIKSLRPIANNKIEVTIKGDKHIDVFYQFNQKPNMYLSDGTIRELKWENILFIKFSAPPSNSKQPKAYGDIFIAQIESSQGVYFGIIDRESSYFSYIYGRQNEVFTISHRNSNIYVNSRATNIRQNSSVSLFMPTVGSVDIEWRQIKTITKGSISQITNAGYMNSIDVCRLKGTVSISGDKSCSGNIAFDLDEALNIEYIDGSNNGIRYILLFNEIAKIEPRNYNYSRITLKNGGVISIGDSRDVNHENDGILMLNSGEYVAWRDVKLIEFDY